MRIDEDALLEVIFTADKNAARQYASAGVKDASISVNASSLNIRPEPTTYKFDRERISGPGIDKHIWIVNATKNGDFFITVRCKVPKRMYAQPLEVNGKSFDEGAEVTLPVNVYTPVASLAGVAGFAQYAGPILSFLLTLPLLSVILTWYLGKKKGSDGGSQQS